MKTGRVTKAGATLVERVQVARALFDRMRGLLGRRKLAANQGIYLRRCNSVHTLGMAFAIDVFFLDSAGVVVRIVRDLKPFRAACGGRHAAAAVEIASGWLPADAVAVGDRLLLEA